MKKLMICLCLFFSTVNAYPTQVSCKLDKNVIQPNQTDILRYFKYKKIDNHTYGYDHIKYLQLLAQPSDHVSFDTIGGIEIDGHI